MNEIQKNLIYLLTCAVNQLTPDAEKVKTVDLHLLYQLARKHSVASAVCMALERVGMQTDEFIQVKKKSIRKNCLLDIERSSILADMEQHGIWYMPLKGSILKDLYPETGMREMADNDILYDAEKQEESIQIMLNHEYEATSVGDGHHDVYMKPPVLNFELHTALFGEGHSEVFNRYYENMKSFLIKDENNNFGYHFSDEDFYVFMTAHEWKHFSNSGTGIRSLLDCYVYVKIKGNSLNWDYITEQMKRLEIVNFEQERRKLASKIFSSVTIPELSESEEKMLMYYLTAGTYGTFENRVHKKLKTQSKFSYFLGQTFPSMDYMKHSVEFVEKYPVLYPVGVVYRWFRGVRRSKGYISRTLKAMKNYDKKKL